MNTSSKPRGFWQCHLDAHAQGSMPAPAAPVTDRGRALARAALDEIRNTTKRGAAVRTADREQFIGLTSWRETPPEYRRVLASLASLSADVAEKADRELTENEKTLLRAAARRLSDGIRNLAGSL